MHIDETFQRVFPEFRLVTTIDRNRDRRSGKLAFHYTDKMTVSGSTTVDAVVCSDLRLSCRPDIWNDSLLMSLGINNVLDAEPPVCFLCGVLGMCTVVHDLPRCVGCLRVSKQEQ